MEPFLAIGELFREKGHQVIAAFPEQFRDLAEESGLKIASLDIPEDVRRDSSRRFGDHSSGTEMWLCNPDHPPYH